MKTLKFKPLIMIGLFILIWSCKSLAQPEFPQPKSGDENGFVAIFDGLSFNGWEGDSVYWRIENGTIVGEVTPETILKRNSFLIWRGGTTGNFELKLEYKISAEGNSGINYRSFDVEGVPFALRGYQCDIDGLGEWTGQNYEERGRQFLALRGQITKINSGEKPFEIGSVGEKEGLWKSIKQDGWNECHLVIQGNTLIHMINGNVMCVVIDEDLENRKNDGLLGVQVHVGPPMKIEYRNIRIKRL